MKAEDVGAAIGVVTLGAMALIGWLGARERPAVRQGPWNEHDAGELFVKLWSDYLRGVIDLKRLESARTVPPQFVTPDAMNRLICVDVAAGRYREALTWRRHLAFEATDDVIDAVISINEAEALACLGQWEAALAHAPAEGKDPLSVAGLCAHRAWVLAELGRLDEARRELAHEAGDATLGLFRSEWHFSRFAIELAAKNWVAAQEALARAESLAARESTRRNLDFLRGRLAFAQRRDDEAHLHFARGSQSGYRGQGGTSLLEWGDALARLGRTREAIVVWTECTKRDPQSPAASRAAERIAEHAVGPAT